MSLARDPTRQRLLEAGLAAFRAKGFDEASVREICAAAGANLAAVSYHFGGKEGLYRAVFDQAFERYAAFFASMPRLKDHLEDPSRGLDLWLEWNIRRIFLDEGPQDCCDLMHQEMRQPSPLLDEVIDRLIRPPMTELRLFLGAVLRRSPEDEEVLTLSTSIIGQSLIFVVDRVLIERLDRHRGPHAVPSPEALVRFQQRFLRGGLNALRRPEIP